MDDLNKQWNMWTRIRTFGPWQSGATAGGAVTAPGQLIHLDAYQHGAFMDVPNCTATGYPVSYYGRGVVSIYHQYSPEIDESDGGNGATNCTSPPESGGTEGGSGQAPGDGSTNDGDDFGSPVLIDLDRGNLELTDLSSGVRFDLNRDGIAEALSWTEPGSGDGWLALDRNGNGVIDDGGELFGNFTDQPPSEAPHGYLALQVFDDDGDGLIGSTDAVYSDLLVWVDRDQDGTSSPSELSDLVTAGVEWIALSVVESRSRDRHGNEFRYRSPVRSRGGMSKSVDVFLLTGP